MTSLQAYKQFLLKLNKNDSNTNINVSKGEFVLRYNEIQHFWLNEKLKLKESLDEIHELEELLVTDEELQFDSAKPRYYSFKMPSVYCHYDSSYTLAEKGNCGERILHNWFIKPKNLNVLLRDENNNPSFEYEETLVILSNKLLNVYYTDFKPKKVFLTYYREPGKIDIEGYNKLDGTQSTNIDPTVNDDIVHEILNRVVLEVIRSYENPEGYVLAADRLKQEF